MSTKRDPICLVSPFEFGPALRFACDPKDVMDLFPGVGESVILNMDANSEQMSTRDAH